MLDITVHGTGDLGSQKPAVRRIRHIGLLNAESIAIYIEGTDDPFIFQLTRDLTFGRHAPNVPVQPIVDLTAFGAYEKGVSRLHAAIRRAPSGAFQIEDLASGNGTWLNGNRLEPHIPSLLKSGDRLALAKLTIEVYLADIVDKPATSPLEPASAGDEDPLKTLPVSSVTSTINEPAQPLLLEAPAPKPLSHYHATLSLGLQHTVNEIGAVLIKIIPHFLKLKDCEIKLTVHIDAHVRSSFDDATIRAVQSAASDLKLDESEFKAQ